MQKDKICSKCREVKCLSLFPTDKAKKDGKGYYCKSCNSEVMKEWRDKNAEHVKKYRKKYYLFGK